MATFDEIFQNYIDYGFTRPTTPVPTVQGIESLTTPMMTQPVMTTPDINVQGRDDRTNQISFNPNAQPLNMEGIMQAVGFMMNPALGIANLTTQQITGKTIAQQVMDAIGAVTGRPTPVSDMYGYTGGSGDTGSAPGAGDPNASMGDTGMATGGDGGGVGSSSDAGAADTSTEGSFAKGGRVGFADGTVIPFEKIKLFELVGEDLYGDWDTFSEVYDDYGADRMWKGISGRPGKYKGGIVSLYG